MYKSQSDNFRKRSQKEREGLYADAYADALKILLPIADNLERAASYTDGDKIVEGVAMTLKQFSGALEKLGIESFGNPGDAFDPNLHNACLLYTSKAYTEAGHKWQKRISN